MKIDVQKHQRKSAFLEVSKTFIVRVVGGWVDGRQFGSFNFPQFHMCQELRHEVTKYI